MKNIVSKIAIVLSVIFIVLSICPITSIECLKGKIPLQDTIINSTDIIDNIMIANIRGLPYKQVPLFYIGLVLIIISSIICFGKSNKLSGLICIVLSVFTTLFIIITHNYIWFLILMNLFLITTLIVDFHQKTKIIIIENIIGIIICVLNIFQLTQHLQLTFEYADITNMELWNESLISLSNITLKIFALWLIPYTILLIKDIITTYKSSRTVN